MDTFHFTNAQGLRGILSSRKLWMTHYEYLNDAVEIKTAHQIILSVIEAHSSSHKEFWEIFLDKFRNILKIGVSIHHILNALGREITIIIILINELRAILNSCEPLQNL